MIAPQEVLGSPYWYMDVLLMHCSVPYQLVNIENYIIIVLLLEQNDNDYFKNCNYVVILVVKHKCAALHLPVDKKLQYLKQNTTAMCQTIRLGIYRVLTSYLYITCLNLNKILL